MFTFVADPLVRLIAIGRESFASDSVLVTAVAACDSDCYHTSDTQSLELSHDQHDQHFYLHRRRCADVGGDDTGSLNAQVYVLGGGVASEDEGGVEAEFVTAQDVAFQGVAHH